MINVWSMERTLYIRQIVVGGAHLTNCEVVTAHDSFWASSWSRILVFVSPLCLGGFPEMLRNRPTPLFYLVLLGLGLRTIAYFNNPDVWHDEAALILNVLGKTYAELLGPLFFSEAAPPGFLLIEKVVSEFFGDGQLALRIVPFVAGCLSLIFVAMIARTMLARREALWCVFLYSCSDALLWHSVEAKPYALDALPASAVLLMFCRVMPVRPRLGCLILALLAPLGILTSFPGCFVFGGVLVALFSQVWQSKDWRAWAGYTSLITSVFASFAVLYCISVQAQHNEEITSCWAAMKKFPDWYAPWTIPEWTLTSTLEVFRYLWRPSGHWLVIPAAMGLVTFWNRDQGPMVILLAVPVVLAFAAALIHAYPYGGSRVMVFSAPGAALAVGCGIERLFNAVRPRAAWAIPAIIAALLIPTGVAISRVINTWDRPAARAAAENVLQHMATDDAVTGNTWEHAYYFRRIGDSYCPLEVLDLSKDTRRLWVVVSGATETLIEDTFRRIASPEWRVLDKSEFQMMKVWLLERD